MVASRAVVLTSALLTALTLALSPAAAQDPTPSLVVDAASGRVLLSERATEPWYPASITKLMTTYVALDLVREGRVGMNTLLTMTPEAAAEPPSKLGVKPGTQLTLENALKIMMVKSANDVAMMVGQNLGGGSVEAFAAMMNDRARRLGMRESRWVNPNGLPDPRQWTSARDMAILARALLTEFPEEEHLFHIGAVKLGATIMRNHNGMLGRYPGADGMKTGFICSGGFNIVASATRGGRRIIAVVFGYGSARERDLRTADLFDAGFEAQGWGAQSVEQLPPSGVMSPPDMRAIVCGPKRRRQPEDDDETALVQASAARAGNTDNPIASLFSPLAIGAETGTSPIGTRRRTLGPRVAFEPIPVWLGATPGSVPDEDAAAAPGRVRIGARPVRTRRIGRADGAVPADAKAFTANLPSPIIAGGATVETLKSGASPPTRKALRASLDPKPAADTKPSASVKPRAAAARRRKPTGQEVAGTNPDAKPARKASRARPADAKADSASAAARP